MSHQLEKVNMETVIILKILELKSKRTKNKNSLKGLTSRCELVEESIHKLENRQLRLSSLRNKKINPIGIIDSVLWDPTWHTNIYISVVSEEEREKGRNNI